MENYRSENSKSGSEIGFSRSYMDLSVDPYEDFYKYSNGKWLENNPIPEDKSSWGSFLQLRELNLARLKDIAEECAKNCSEKGKSNRDLVGRFYKSIMNRDEIERRKFDPVRPHMDRIDSVKNFGELFERVIELHKSGIFPLFTTMSASDEKNSSIYAFYMFQGGLVLPNRDYYLDEKFEDVRSHYREYIIKALNMYGMSEEESRSNASIIMEFETSLAKVSRRQEDLRDPEKNYNKMNLNEFHKTYGSLDLRKYLSLMGVARADYVIVGQPEFFAFVSETLGGKDLSQLKTYVKWSILNSFMPMLHKEAEDLHFDMFMRKIMGQKEQEERWKKAIRTIDELIGEALGELYMERYFGEESRRRMDTMIRDIREVFSEKIKKLEWMSDETKERALHKFSKFRAKIGGPVKFRDYSSIEILENDYVGNVLRSAKFEVQRQAKRVGEEVDREEWGMTPPTVNAYFDPTKNEIVFPAGIIQPPFFDPTADDPVNYGGIGGVICHEITHGYDDQGRRYDENGNIRDWWTEEDATKFMERAKMISDLYGSLEVVPGFKVNGNLTLGENIADFGGVSISYAALQKHFQKHPELRKEIDGFTPEQRFFISWAQIWKENSKVERSKMLVSIDPHSPGKFRGVIPVYNHPEFKKAFKSPKGLEKPIYDRAITIW
ncbi:M13 family metallopeptidase [Cuniculiplasma sp. SKW4]|uniref:M13 family metallopeptidase n=1 Tax=Cuniculiplasma sp. SKW4 TaxID=3400171 RepID=UPI003FD6558B